MIPMETKPITSAVRLVTSRSYAPGQLIQTISQYQITNTPTDSSIQVGVDKHIEELGILAFLHHSCDPTVIVDTSTFEIVAARAMEKGEPLTFFYPSTEWEMAKPFICQCRARHCIRSVAGAKYLAIDQLAPYFINQHIRDLLLQTLTPAPRVQQSLPGYAPLLLTMAGGAGQS